MRKSLLKYLSIALLALIFSSFASIDEINESDTSSESDISGVSATCEGDPSGWTPHSVGVIHGGYSEETFDFILGRTDTLRWKRSSEGSTFIDKDRVKGAMNPYLYAYGEYIWRDKNGPTEECMWVADPYGSPLPYYGSNKPLKSITLHLAKPIQKKGFTNASAGVLSGRTDLRNLTFFAPFSEQVPMQVTFGNGTVCHYSCAKGVIEKKEKEKSWTRRRYEYLRRISFEKRPNGWTVDYGHDAEGRVISAVLKTPTGNEVASWQLKKSIDSPNFTIETSDGREYRYEYALSTDLFDTKVLQHPKFPKEPQYFLTAVEGTDLLRTEFEYDYFRCGAKDFHPHIVSKKMQGGRELQIQHYVDGYNQVGAERVYVKAKSNAEWKFGRVCAQRAPLGQDGTMLLTHAFYYSYLGSGENKIGEARVVDTLGHTTRYQWRKKDERLASIAYEDVYEGAKGKVCFEYKGPNLMAKEWLDPSGKRMLKKSFVYDDRGNVLEEHLIGEITGKKPLEEQVTYYTYTNDGLNLVTSSTNPLGVKTEIKYLPGTNLEVEKFCSYQGKIFAREFWVRDADGFATLHIQDDGSSCDAACMADVMVRSHEYIEPVKMGSAAGLPAVRRVCYWEKGQEHLLEMHHYKYDRRGNCIEEKIWDGDETFLYTLSWCYNEKNQLIEEIDARGYTKSYEYDAFGNAIHVVGPTPGIESFQVYDRANRLVSKRTLYGNEEEIVESWEWDPLGRCTAYRNGHGNVTEYSYDCLNHCTETRYPAILNAGVLTAHTEHKTYDLLGRVTVEVDVNGYETRRKFNALGSPLSIYYPDGTEEHFEYTLAGLLAKHIHKNGSYTQYTHDYLGQVVKEETFDPQGKRLKFLNFTYKGPYRTQQQDTMYIITYFSYDGAGRLIEEKSTFEVRLTRYFYDAQGRQSSVRTGNCWVYLENFCERDLLGNVLAEEERDQTGKLWKRTTYEWDAYGNCVASHRLIDEGVIATTRVAYDLQKRTIKVTDPLGHEQHTYYTTVTNELGQYVAQTTVIDAAGYQTLTTYDAGSNIACVEERSPFGKLLARRCCEWNGTHKKVVQVESVVIDGQVTDQIVYAWKYGPGDRLEKEVHAVGTPDEKVVYQSYDENGMLHIRSLPNGTHLIHEYTYLGSMARLYSEGGDAQAVDYTFVYDEGGRCTAMDDNLYQQNLFFKYNQVGHKLFESLKGCWTHSYGYNLFDERAKFRSSYGMQGTYTYELNRLKAVDMLIDTQSYHLEIEDRSMQSWITRYTINEETIDTPCDILGRPAGITSAYHRQKIGNYDARGHLDGYVMEDGLGHYEEHYTYDDLGHVIYEKGVKEHTYAFDSLHNRRMMDDTIEQSNKRQQLLQQGDRSYFYDKNGNLLIQEEGNQRRFFSYDALDRLVAVEETGKWRTEMRYDALNRRTEKKYAVWVEGSWQQEWLEYYLWDDKCEVGTLDENKQLKEWRWLMTAPAEVGANLLFWKEGTLYMPLQDYRGSVVGLYNFTTKEVVEQYRYTAFGDCEAFDSEGLPLKRCLSPWRFSSKRIDEETGLYYFGRRYYAPWMGRWITEDPEGLVDGVNLYAYVIGNPVTYFDPFGLYKVTFKGILKGIAMLLGEMTLQVMGGGNLFGFSWDALFKGVEKMVFHAGILPFVGLCRLARGDLTAPSFVTEHTKNDTYSGTSCCDKIRHTFCNGMNNSLEDIIQMSAVIAGYFAGVPIHYTYNATSGTAVDLAESVCNKMGMATDPVEALVQNWRTCIAEMGGVGGGGRIIHCAHSQGGLITSLALKRLNPEELAMLEIYTFGSAVMIPSYDGMKAKNFVSVWDPVPWTDCFGILAGIFFPHASQIDIEFVGSFSQGVPIKDHSFLGGSYEAALKNLGKHMVNKHQQKCSGRKR